jgi:hypothetical protein
MPMRYLYVDEAGTSAKEPVTVVVGILVHADSHWLSAATRIRQLFDSYVPENRRRGFIFHAKEVLGGGRDLTDWDFAARIKLVKAMVKIPRQLGMVICLGMVRRDAGAPDLRGKLRPEKFQHLFAFQHCVANADQYLRTYANPSEVASIVAEDVHDMRRFLRAGIDMLRERPNTLPAGAFMPTSENIEFGTSPLPFQWKITKIVDNIHFEVKTSAPLLQIADACAFSFRRRFADQRYGEELVRAMIKNPLGGDEWKAPASGAAFYGHLRLPPR